MDTCIIEDCLLPPTCKCLCTGTEDSYCAQHLEVHLSTGDNHNVVSCHFKNTREEILVNCKVCKNKINAANNKIMQVLVDLIGKLTRDATDYIEQNRSMEQIYIGTINYLDNENDYVVKKTNYSSVEEFILKYSDDPNQISKDFNLNQAKFLESLDIIRKLEYSSNELLKLKAEIDEFKELFVSFDKIKTENTKYDKAMNYLKTILKHEVIEDLFCDYQSSTMCFFENNTKQFCVIDVLSGNDTETTLNIDYDLTYFTGCCELPNSKYFYYSGIGDGNQSNICYIIDIQNKIGVKQKGNINKAYIGSCCYVNNYVYSFGGCLDSGESCVESERFNLLTGEWHNIPSIPTPCHAISTAFINDMIIISAFTLTGIIEYNTITNYSTVYLNGCFVPSHKVLCKGLGGIYLFTQGVLWDIIDYKQDSLSLINSSTGIPNYYLIAGPIRYGLNIYFILTDKQIWRFNLLTKEIKILRKCQEKTISLN